MHAAIYIIEHPSPAQGAETNDSSRSLRVSNPEASNERTGHYRLSIMASFLSDLSFPLHEPLISASKQNDLCVVGHG